METALRARQHWWVAPAEISHPLQVPFHWEHLQRHLQPNPLRLPPIMDNLSSHKGPGTRMLIQPAGVSLIFLPPYSPDFNPIENAFAKLKAMLRKAAERSKLRLPL